MGCARTRTHAHTRTCAPPLRRYVDDPLSDTLLSRRVPHGTLLTVDLDASGQVVVQQSKEVVLVTDPVTGQQGEMVVTREGGGRPEGMSNVVEYTALPGGVRKQQPVPARRE